MNPDFDEVLTAGPDAMLSAFDTTALRLGTAPQNIEKDFWVCWTLDIDQTWRLSRIKGWRVWGNARKQGAAEWQGCRTGGFEFGDCRRVRGDEFVEGP